MIRAAIFDFDETVVHLESQHDAASAALASEHGDDYLRLPESFRHRSGYRVIDDVADMKAFFEWSESLETLYRRRQELFHEQCSSSRIELLPGVEHVVTFLVGRGCLLGIASSGSRESIRRILLRLGLDRVFGVVVAGEDVTKGKPDPEPYEVAAFRLGVRPEECVVFEDSTVGVQAAKRAGCTVVGVRNPFALMEQDLGVADLVVTGMEGLVPELAELVSGALPAGFVRGT